MIHVSGIATSIATERRIVTRKLHLIAALLYDGDHIALKGLRRMEIEGKDEVTRRIDQRFILIVTPELFLFLEGSAAHAVRKVISAV